MWNMGVTLYTFPPSSLQVYMQGKKSTPTRECKGPTGNNLVMNIFIINKILQYRGCLDKMSADRNTHIKAEC